MTTPYNTTVNFKEFGKEVYEKYKFSNALEFADVVLLLVNFKMQSNGFYALVDAAEYQSNLYENYHHYIEDLLKRRIVEPSVKNKRHPDSPTFDDIEVIEIDKQRLLEYLEKNNDLELNVKKLRELICFTNESIAPIPSQHFAMTGDNCKEAVVDLELWNKSVNLVVSDKIDKFNDAKSIKEKNARQNGTKTWPFEIKSVYKALKNMSNGCKCISLALEKVVLSDMENEPTNFSPDQLNACKETKLAKSTFVNNNKIPADKEKAVKAAVNLAMSSDSIAITRIYKKSVKENDITKVIWDPKWHKVKCDNHPNSSNTAPTKK